VRARHRDARRDGVALGDLLVNRVLKVGKGRAHEWMTLKDLMKPRMLYERFEVMPVESLEETTDHSLRV
jgi:hypothetical protein